ncbi:MAG: ribonuclease H-like domain-containing protein [Myxococcota bacterium]|nr:ribonuclease H-like domain-containing protein [Myxococcota bacterium]
MELLSNGRILTFDIETTDFKANFGYMLMWAAKFLDEDWVWYATIADNEDYGTTPLSMMDDKLIVTKLRDIVDEADAVVAHYGSRFDLPFLNTRCLLHGIAPPSPVTVIDTWRIARSQLAMTSNRLGTLTESLNEKDNRKSSLPKEDWKLAIHGDEGALARMLDYNIDDVTSTEELYIKLLPVIKNHPYVGPAPSNRPATETHTCPACGSEHTHAHDSRRTKNFSVFRRRCMNCGTAFESARRKIKP